MSDVLPGPTTGCIEAETLAAWADGALGARERERVEAHVSSCANCQTLVAMFARSLPEPAGSLAGGVAPGFWTQWRWAWITAATTAAVAVAVWVSVPRVSEQTPPVQTMASRDAVPEPAPLPTVPQAKQEAAPVTPPSSAAASPVPNRSVSALEKTQSLRREVGAAPPADVTESRTGALPSALPPPPSTAADAGPARAAAAPLPMSPPPPAAQSTAEVRDAAPLVQAASGERSSTVARQQLESLPSPAGADHNFLGFISLQPAVSGNNRVGGGGQANYMLDGLSALDAAAVVAEIVPSTTAPRGQGRGGAGGRAMEAPGTLAAQAGAASTSVVPGVTRWRVFAAGQVARVTAAAPAGQLVVFDRPVFITAGAAPNPLVCWLVGRGGAVALSVDAERFRSVAFPETTDLRSITATSALQATVTTVLGTVYTTVDGGATWRLVSR